MTAEPAPAPAEPQRLLRDTLGRYATGVTVVTAGHRGRAVGMTVNSFSSVSLDPPLVLWCVRRASARQLAFTTASHFAINVLAADQHPLAVRFAQRGASFADVPHEVSRHGPVVLTDAAATLLCRVERTFPAGDHIVLIGEVVEHRAGFGTPLVFLDGAYRAAR
jgi:flavin reductase (DIM6/NTAB) family NADH-FMN oxidoreductase RutF